jgi:hypothetical protein
MHRSAWAVLLIVLCIFWLFGCGGGAQTLTGGSVPIGGRAVTGVVLLPDGTAAASAQVTVRSLPSGAVIQTSSTDSAGRFTVQGISTANDVSVVVNQPPVNMLEAVVPRSALADHPDRPLDIGSVTAITTVVAAAIHLEHAPAPEDEESIVSNQQGHLMMQAQDAGYSVDTQNQFIRDPSSLMAQALTLILPTANTELAAFAAQPTTDTASSALNGLLGYVRAAHRHEIHLNGGMRTALINAQLAGKVYSPDTIASALNAAGVANATAAAVSAASQRERAELTALSGLGAGISPLEALVIATDDNTHGGFQLDQGGLNRFLVQLLK